MSLGINFLAEPGKGQCLVVFIGIPTGCRLHSVLAGDWPLIIPQVQYNPSRLADVLTSNKEVARYNEILTCWLEKLKDFYTLVRLP